MKEQIIYTQSGFELIEHTTDGGSIQYYIRFKSFLAIKAKTVDGQLINKAAAINVAKEINAVFSKYGY